MATQNATCYILRHSSYRSSVVREVRFRVIASTFFVICILQAGKYYFLDDCKKQRFAVENIPRIVEVPYWFYFIFKYLILMNYMTYYWIHFIRLLAMKPRPLSLWNTGITNSIGVVVRSTTIVVKVVHPRNTFCYYVISSFHHI